MVETTALPQNDNENKKDGGFLSWFIFMAKGFIFPCFSPSFYKTASRKRLITPVAFFILLGIIITFVTTIQVVVAMNKFGNEIQGAYERGEIPTIVIEDGIASVDGPQPMIFEDDRTIFAIDTTGKITEIDTRNYSEGFLLTRTEFHVVNDDGYRVILLNDLHQRLGNPIVIDKTQTSNLWKKISFGINVFAFIGILIWNSLFRFTYTVLIGLIAWGLTSIIRKGIGFSPILITGIYATVPVIYLKFLLKLVNIKFFGLYTLLLIAIWALALWSILRNTEEKIEVPLDTDFIE